MSVAGTIGVECRDGKAGYLPRLASMVQPATCGAVTNHYESIFAQNGGQVVDCVGGRLGLCETQRLFAIAGPQADQGKYGTYLDAMKCINQWAWVEYHGSAAGQFAQPGKQGCDLVLVGQAIAADKYVIVGADPHSMQVIGRQTTFSAHIGDERALG